MGYFDIKGNLEQGKRGDLAERIFSETLSDADCLSIYQLFVKTAPNHWADDWQPEEEVRRVLSGEAGEREQKLFSNHNRYQSWYQAHTKSDLGFANSYSALSERKLFLAPDPQNPPVCFATGFSLLDSHLDGGLHAGLYTIGAVTGVGTTSFVLQIADTVAASGSDVLYISPTIRGRELMARSISRQIYVDLDLDKDRAMTVSDIFYRTAEDLSGERGEAFRTAAEAYFSGIAGHMFFVSRNEDGGAPMEDQIRELVSSHIETRHTKPLVVVDSLQDAAGSEQMDSLVQVLRDLIRKYDLPILAVYKVDAGYEDEPASLSMFAKSGTLGAASDMLFGLTAADLDYMAGERPETHVSRLRALRRDIAARKENRDPCELELRCMKARNGYPFLVRVLFVSAFHLFAESQSNQTRKTR